MDALERLFSRKFPNELQQKAYEKQLMKDYPKEFALWKERYNSFNNGSYDNDDDLAELLKLNGISPAKTTHSCFADNKKHTPTKVSAPSVNYDYIFDNPPYDDPWDPAEYERNQALKRRPDWLQSSDMTEEEYWDSVDYD